MQMETSRDTISKVTKSGLTQMAKRDFMTKTDTKWKLTMMDKLHYMTKKETKSQSIPKQDNTENTTSRDWEW